MLRKKLHLLVVLVTAAVLIQTNIVWAKGAPNQVGVTGPGIDGEYLSQSGEILHGLSLGRFESFMEPISDVPETSDEPYIITRYYQTAPDQYSVFDIIHYYPPTGDRERGYVYYDQMLMGDIEYVGQWFWVTAQGETAFASLLTEMESDPYLLLMDATGGIQFVDPVTLETVSNLAIGSDAMQLTEVHAYGGGEGLTLLAEQGESSQRLTVNLSDPVGCVVSEAAVTATGYRFPSSDGRWQAVVVPHETASRVAISDLEGTYPSRRIEGMVSDGIQGAWDSERVTLYLLDRNRLLSTSVWSVNGVTELPLVMGNNVDAGNVTLAVAGAANERLYVYSTTDAGQGDTNGIFVIDTTTGEQIDQWQPSIQFNHVLLHGDHLYGVQSGTNGDTTLYVLDRSNGSIVTSREFSGQIAGLAYDRFVDSVRELDQSVACAV